MFRALELIGSSLRFMRPLAVVKNSEDCLRNFIIYGREEVFSSVAKELIVMGAILESQLNGGEASVQSRLGGSQDLFMHLQCVGQALSSVAQHGDGRKYWDNEFQSYRPLPEPAPPEKMVRGFEKTFPED